MRLLDVRNGWVKVRISLDNVPVSLPNRWFPSRNISI